VRLKLLILVYVLVEGLGDLVNLQRSLRLELLYVFLAAAFLALLALQLL